MSLSAREVISRVTLDVGLSTCQHTVGVTQGDTSRKIHAVLASGGKPMQIPPGSTAVFMAETEGGTGIFDPCDIDNRGCEIQYSVSANVTASAGYVEGNFTVLDRDGTVLVAPRIGISVIENRFADNVVDSESYDALAALVSRFTADRAELSEEHGQIREQLEEVNHALATATFVPRVGENGNWWIGETDTGVDATPEDGSTPYIGGNGNWWLGENDTGVDATPADGMTPHIGENLHWFIGSADTGIVAQGQDGADGLDGADGTDGHTPVKGTDYWTEADKAEMVADVLSALPTWEGGSF